MMKRLLLFCMGLFFAFGLTQAQTVSIYDIQYSTNGPLFESAYKGQTITTTGTVTGLLSNGYNIQDSASAWNGVFVFDNTNTPALGDNVTLTAEVDEFFELTELKNVSAFSVNSSGNALPAVSAITTANANMESWEGVLIMVSNANCTNDDTQNNFGQWEINDGTGAVLVDDAIFAYQPALNDKYNVTGLMSYSFSERKILPRDANDVELIIAVDPALLKSVEVFPNPAADVLKVDLAEINARSASVQLVDLKGSVVLEREVEGQSISLDVADLARGSYLLNVQIEDQKVVKRVVLK